MIIVFALMGSILAGYALNINGTSTVMNEYEKVTDVSGLYSHTQEPSYIDYNPASNYIGYSTDTIAYTNTPTNPGSGGMEYLQMKKIFGNATITINNDHEIIYNGVSFGVFDTGGTLYYRQIFFSNEILVTAKNGEIGFYFAYGGNGGYSEKMTDNVTLNISNETITASGTYLDNTTFNITKDNKGALIYWPYSDFDYYNNRTGGQYRGAIPTYYSNDWPVYEYLLWSGLYYTSINTDYISLSNGVWGNTTIFPGTNTDLGGGIYQSTDVNNVGSYHVYYPRYILIPGLGINYTESNRVNNYPIVKSDASTTTVTQQINPVITGTDYFPLNYVNSRPSDLRNLITIYTPEYHTNAGNVYTYGDYMCAPVDQTQGGNDITGTIHNFALSDIIANSNIPANAETVTITTNGNTTTQTIYSWYHHDDPDSAIPLIVGTWSIDTNMCFINTRDDWVDADHYGHINGAIAVQGGANAKNYAIYNVSSGTVDIYNYQGVKISTKSVNDVFVCSVSNPGNYAACTTIVHDYHDPAWPPDYTLDVMNYGYMNLTGLLNSPYMTITYDLYDPADIEYIDITKGYYIDSNNIVNTVWDNGYINGVIDILFRSDGTGATLENNIVVGDNDINIKSIDNGFYVTLNNGEPVNIGKWRNIVLNIDLVNGRLSVIPVRTFNSFTNVVTDNTNIFIGDLINPVPTNTIEWKPTNKSLAFNIYSTDVFMDTYGIVMVDPTLDVTNYFTNLDNFYQLRLSDFSIYGQSMTVNGVTGIVTGDKITFNDETIQLKEMTITYADGNVTISDSYGNIDLGAIVDNTVSMTGAWYFISDLYSGYTTQKVIYDWDWGEFVLEDKAFGVIYIGLCLIGLIVARHFCTLTITDYLLFVVSIAIALTVPVIA